MKTSLFAFALFCCFLSITASAQTNAIRVDVPFAFVANGTVLPAGSYEFRGMAGNGSFVRIENTQSGEVVLLQSRPIPLQANGVQENTKLVFIRADNAHVLHQVRLAGDSHTHDMVHMDDTEPGIRPDA